MTDTSDDKIKMLRRATWTFKLQRGIETATAIAQDVIFLRRNPSLLDITAMGVKLIGSIAMRQTNSIECYFDEWMCIDDVPFIATLMDVITKHPTRKLGGVDGYMIMSSTVFGEEIGWIQVANRTKEVDLSTTTTHESQSWFQGPWIHHDRYKAVMAGLGRAMWEHIASKWAILTPAKGATHSNGDKITIKHDASMDEDVMYTSRRGDEIYDRLKLFHDAGVTRSVMLVGVPGTGKTTIMKACARRFSRHTLRIHISELGSMSIDAVLEAIKLLRPEVLIIDDFDRLVGGHTTLLGALEVMNQIVSVLMLSVNDITEIDPAVIRPGRVDMLMEVSKIDNDVIDKLLEKYDIPLSARQFLVNWPVAYIVEFAKRVKILGVDETMRELIEFRYRAEHVNVGRHGTGLPSLDEMRASFEDIPERDE